DDPAPETADGYFFGCRSANVYLPAYSEYYYNFYIISQKPIDLSRFDFNSGLKAQSGVTIKEYELKGLKENSYGLNTLPLRYSLPGLTEDWRPYAFLLAQVTGAESSGQRYVQMQRLNSYSKSKLAEAEEKAAEWFKTVPKIHAYVVTVTFNPTGAQESTDTVTVSVGGKSYTVNCGIIKTDDGSAGAIGSGLKLTGGTFAVATVPYSYGYASSSVGAVYTANERVTVTGVQLLSASGKAELEQCNITIAEADGASSAIIWEEGSAFSVPLGAKVTFDCRIYDSMADAELYAGNMILKVTYKGTDGKEWRQASSLKYIYNSSLYLIALQEFYGVNVHAFYEYVINPMQLRPNVWEKKYGGDYPQITSMEQYYDYLEEFFGAK
ncbi:MAG: hypothetical protein II794_08480, partial [Oscillospiraceae bacterium]|nr:hypothetical protein [Oscillospiraceae bacterium]